MEPTIFLWLLQLSLHDNLCCPHPQLFSGGGCDFVKVHMCIKQLALHRSAYRFDPFLQIDLKVDGHDEPFCTENKLWLNLKHRPPFSGLP